MQVRVILGAQSAYAAIKADNYTLDIRLNPGQSPASSLHHTVTQLREEAARLERRADRITLAIAELDRSGNTMPSGSGESDVTEASLPTLSLCKE